MKKKIIQACNFPIFHYIYYVALITVSQNGVAFIPNTTQEVILTCKFSKPVDCVWLRRENHLEIGGRYTYTNNLKGINTMDCTIKVNPVVFKIDYGRWECVAFVDSTQDAHLTSLTVSLSNGMYKTDDLCTEIHIKIELENFR